MVEEAHDESVEKTAKVAQTVSEENPISFWAHDRQLVLLHQEILFMKPTSILLGLLRN